MTETNIRNLIEVFGKKPYVMNIWRDVAISGSPAGWHISVEHYGFHEISFGNNLSFETIVSIIAGI